MEASALESRLAALEKVLALPSDPQATSGANAEEVAALEGRITKLEYRIKHLVKSYEAKVAEVEALQKQLAEKK